MNREVHRPSRKTQNYSLSSPRFAADMFDDAAADGYSLLTAPQPAMAGRSPCPLLLLPLLLAVTGGSSAPPSTAVTIGTSRHSPSQPTPARTNTQATLELQLVLKIPYRHRTGTTRIRILTTIYHRSPPFSTGNFTDIYIICVKKNKVPITGTLPATSSCRYTTDYRW